MIKKMYYSPLYLLLFFILFSSFLLSSKALALPFAPSLYISAGAAMGSSSDSGPTIDSNKFTDLSINNNNKVTNKGYLLNVGIAPNLPLPFVNALRGELEFSSLHDDNAKERMLGLGVYYDFFKFLPFINPYVGAMIYSFTGSYYYDISYKDIDGNYKTDNIKHATGSQTLTSFRAGLNINIPTTALQIFTEMRYTTNKLTPYHFYFVKKYDTEKNANSDHTITIRNGNYSLSSAVIGLRYFIL